MGGRQGREKRKEERNQEREIGAASFSAPSAMESSLSPERFLAVASVLVTALLGYVAVVVALVGFGRTKGSRSALPVYAKPLKPLLSHFLGKAPKTPRVTTRSKHNEITVEWSGSASA